MAIASSVPASASTFGPMSTPNTNSRTTSGTRRRGTSPASSGASTTHTRIQNNDVVGPGIGDRLLP